MTKDPVYLLSTDPQCLTRIQKELPDCIPVDSIESLFEMLQPHSRVLLFVDVAQLEHASPDALQAIALVLIQCPPARRKDRPEYDSWLQQAIAALQPAAVLPPDPTVQDVRIGYTMGCALLNRGRLERQRREALFQVLQRIAEAVEREDSLLYALQSAQQILAESVDAVYAETWIPDSGRTALIHSGIWFRSSHMFEGFFQESLQYSFVPGEGLPGAAWQSGELQWRTDVRTDRTFLRAALAERYQLGAGFAIPLFAGEELVSVGVYFFDRPRVIDPYIVELVSRAAWEFQQTIAHKSEMLESRRKQEHIRQLLGFRDQFLYNLNHEIRTPMNGVIGMASVLAEDAADPEQREFAEAIVTSAQRLMSSFEQLVFFLQEIPSDPETLNSQLEGVNLNDVLSSVCDQHTITATRRRIQFKPILRLTPYRVVGSRQLIGFVCSNLLEFCFSQAHNETTLRVESAEDKPAGNNLPVGLVVQMEYQGECLPDSVIDAVNSPDANGEALYRATTGVGPALPLAQRITAAFNGRFHLESLGRCRYRITVSLPVSEVEYSQPAASTAVATDDRTDASDAAHQQPAVLLAEDNRINQLVLARHLRSRYAVETAATVQQALKLAGKKRFALLLLDINLGNGTDGVGLLQQIRRGSGPNAATPAIAITGYTQSGDVDWLLDVGFAEVLGKPVLQQQLLDRVQTVVSRTENQQ
ncbi:response regulator [Spirochaeta africana]|uniref:histidine kinase n=1 Tax=Spirochaeta africana (strain ATCC 700263 / DSM 8902 / Z-7692) TaxID=889378 RepID=H9UJW0_SPIAZ|nr:response regulator [Spirochaeta africana]AFG37803.1 histidine kinase with response regulator receiver domain [Spirochaeta africana DSM 8902]